MTQRNGTFRRTISMTFALLAAAMLTFGGAIAARAQDATPEAKPDCTANLGVVRSTKACVSILHASPDAPAVDIYANGEKVVENLAYGDNTGFLEIPAGSYELEIAPTGTDPAAMSIKLPALEVAPAKAYEIAAIGPLAALQLTVNEVTTYAIAKSAADLEQSRVRLFHTFAGAPNVTVTLIAGDIAIDLANDLAFGSVSDYIELPAGTYQLIVRTADGSQTLLELTEFTIEPNKVITYNIFPSAEPGVELVTNATTPSTLPAPAATPVA